MTAPNLDLERLTIPAGHAWNRLPLIAGIVGVIGVLASVALGRSNPGQFYFSWLVSFLFFLSVALGGMFFVLTHFLTNAKWSVVLRRLAENIMGTLPLFILLFIPIAIGMHELFHWTHEDAVAHDSLLQSKRGYLNQTFFLIRAAVCLLLWTLMSWWFLRASRKQDRTGDPGIRKHLIKISAPGLALFAITLTVAAIDWIMSLDPHWYSTMFGVYYFAGCVVGIFAFMAIFAAAMRRANLLGSAVTIEHFHDMGKMLFAFTVFWAYIAFSQYFLIWYGNLPEETVWYMHRAEGSWKWVSAALGWGHFAIPFLYLMSRHIKRRIGLLVPGAIWMLGIHLVDLHWLIMPTYHKDSAHPSLLDLTTFIGIGGLFVAVVGWRMRGHALIPIKDPCLQESLRFENF